MFEMNFNMAETIAFAIVLLLIGRKIKEHVTFLQKFFIPAPVVGGTLFSIILLIGHQTETFTINFNSDIRVLLMTAFFTTIGFSASLSLLKKGGIGVLIFLIVATILVTLQDVLGVTLAKVFGLNPLIGLAAGSVPLTGGHGTSATFGPTLENFGAVGAEVVALASATYGLIAGCLIGGPIARRLLNKHNLKPTNSTVENSDILEEDKKMITEDSFFKAVIIIGISMGIGSVIYPYIDGFLKSISDGKMGLPAYIASMLIAAIFRNVSDSMKKPLPFEEIRIVGNISLSLFLSMALMSLKLWQLADLALPLIAILLIQTVMMAIFAYFITFNVMGRDYDAAVMATGHCGFGLGASPNAIANMETFTTANGPSPKAFFILPIVAACFIDFTNALIISFFISIFK
ncbi:sodium/glutamate symporter [Fusobacterium nucleatum]|uniref:Sodium/glutamate symporter n=1 Tax=Fusobacterium nucleatum TaxID=851 RepID=A0A2N6TLV2_FUSNU|nr:sodium/glutamate symporter [Fusobacterium nucleatum]PMC70269.1 sodium/glutamate symporter [Fusobacterium nucleatum]